MNKIRFGIVGCGLMGREFASAAARWCHLVNLPARPDIVAVCDQNPALFGWYAAQCPELKLQTTEYRELLANQDVDAVYAAVPHHLHEEIYTATIRAGKHLMGEKPFGIDLAAAEAIVAAADQRPGGLIRCSSESVFFPAMQRIGAMIEERRFGRILEVDTGFLHSSDLDPDKPLNWKRMVRYNGEYGVLGDLGMHACHLPLRAGWRPRNVRAILSDVVQERPDGKGGRARCDTWDNAVLLCETADPATGERFPWTMKTQRIAPGQRNHWYTRINGTRASARWSSVAPDVLEVLEYNGKEQVWGTIQTGHETAYKTITGDIFQFGFTDSILQMWAAFVQEISGGQALKKFAGCVTPAEALLSHRIFTAALESHRNAQVVAITGEQP